MAYPNRALIAVAHGHPLALVWSAEDWISSFINDAGGGETFALEDISADYEDSGDGIFTAAIRVVDDGPGDWPGSRECVVQFTDFTHVTADEWAAHCRGDWPWDVPPTVGSPTVGAVDDSVRRDREEG